MPPTCTNAAFALRQHYSRYLESFERINFFGEDAEDVLAAGRPHTPVGGGTSTQHVPLVATADYISVISTSKDPKRNFDKLVLSLQCGMPNEVDFAINICMLLSNVSNSVFNLSKAPAVVDTLLAHIGVFSEDSHGLGELYEQWYAKQDMERDFTRFWKEGLTVKGVEDILCSDRGDETTDQESLFHPSRKKIGAKDVECQRISQVGMIFYNFSFDSANADVLASHPLCLKFLVLCICSNHGFLQRMAWETLSNLAEKMLMDPIESTNTQMFFQMLHCFLDHKDRYHAINAMDVLGKLCTLERNDEVIEAGLEPEAYQSLIKVLSISDVQLVLSSLESLYNLSGVGQVTSDHIAEVYHSIDILVCLVTMDAESFGPEALSEVQILEKRIPTALPATPKPQPATTPVAPPQPREPVQPHQAPPSSPSPGPVTSPSPSPAPIKTTGSEIDPETFTYNWLQGTYEHSPGNSVSRIDIYADYLSSCSRLARVGILNATAFNRIIKLAFPDGQLRRVQSGVNVQYVLAGLKRRANPLPVKSRTDSPAPQHVASPHVAAQQQGQRMSPAQQAISRTPTPPVQNQMSPGWNPPKQQNIAVAQQTPPSSMPRHYEKRSTPQVSVSNQPQMPGMSQLPRRLSTPGQGAIQATVDQGVRQFTTPALQQQNLQNVANQRHMIGGQIQRSLGPTDKAQTLERVAAMRRASVEGSNALQAQNPQVLQHHTHGQIMQRMPISPQSPGPPRGDQQQMAHSMPSTVQASPAQSIRAVVPRSPVSPQMPLVRSPLPTTRPTQPLTSQPTQTPPSVGFMQRPVTAAEPSSYRPTAAYRQPAPAFPQQQSIRPAPPAYSGRPLYHGAYPPLAPKPAPGVNVQFSQENQLRKQVSSSTAVSGSHPGTPQVPRPSFPRGDVATRQTFPPHVPVVNTPPSPVLPPSSRSGQPFRSSQPDLSGVHSGRNIRPGPVKESRQQFPGIRQEGVVLIAQEERAADVVSTGLLEGAAEQKIVVIENKNRTDIISNSSLSTAHAITAHEQLKLSSRNTAVNTGSEICGSNIDEQFEQSLERVPLNLGGKNSLQSLPKSTLYPSSNGSLKRDLNTHTTHGSRTSASNEENLNGQRDNVNDEFGQVKRPRLDSRMSSLENELDSSSSIPSRTGSPTPLVNGEIKGDPRNKLMDKLLDKDLHLPLNGVCGIDSSDIDLLASDGERLSSSKASSPDLFGSETNSDFGKYLEESDTDTGLFSDVLQGDLRIDPMENGTEGTHQASSKMPSFPVGTYNEGGIPAGVTHQQGKVPIPPTVRPDPVPVQYNATVNRTPLAGNSPWNSTNNVNLESSAGFSLPSASVNIQKATFPHQNNQPNSQQIIVARDSSSVQPSTTTTTKSILPRPQGPDIVNSKASVSLGLGIQQSLMTSSFHGGQQMAPGQTTLPRRGMPPGWAPSGVQQQQLPIAPHAARRVPPGSQTPAPIGFQVASPVGAPLEPQGATVPPGSLTMGLSPGWQPQLQQQQKSVNVHPDVRTQSVATPGTSNYEAASTSQNRPPTSPMQSQHHAMPPAGKNVVQNPVGSKLVSPTAPQEFVPTPPPRVSQVEFSVPQMVSFKPFRCRWTTCYSSFDTSKELFAHVVSEHVPRDSLVMSCMWEGCPLVRRSRSSLLFHLQQKHSEASPAPSALPPQPTQHQSPPVQPPPQPQPNPQPPPPTTPSTSFVPAYHFLARMLQSLQGEEESPLTKSVRLTAALVLRNVAQYSALARSLLRRHESRLSLIAMSNSEAANAIAACLSELSPHRKASSEDSGAFFWAPNR